MYDKTLIPRKVKMLTDQLGPWFNLWSNAGSECKLTYLELQYRAGQVETEVKGADENTYGILGYKSTKASLIFLSLAKLAPVSMLLTQ